MLQKNHTILASFLLVAGLPTLVQSGTLPAVPFPPPFPASGYLEIDVKKLPPGLTVTGCAQPIDEAKGDGITDDGCAVQAAMNHVAAEGGGVVYLPKGNYFINRTLLIGDKTWVVGAGTTETTLLRGTALSKFRIHSGVNHCDEDYFAQDSLMLFSNTKYNCGNTGIVLANFKIDGSDVPEPNISAYPSVTIAFSAIEDTHIWNLHIENVPQDAIFFRNGGVRTSIMNTMIDGFNMKWHNGGAINIEMWGNGNIGYKSSPSLEQRPPVLVMGNTIISRSSFLDGQVHGIDFNRPINDNVGAAPPRVLIQNNKIQVTNNQTAIACFDCIDSTIMDNRIEPTNDGNDRFTGINLTGGGFQVLNNEIIGSEYVTNDGRGILIGPAMHHEKVDKEFIPVVHEDIDPTDAVVIGKGVATK